MKTYKAKGNNFEIGVQIGKELKDSIHESFDDWAYFHKEIKPFLASEKGRLFYNQILEIQKKEVPKYLSELKGIAQGSNKPINDLVCLNMLDEFRFQINHERELGCSNCTLVDENQILIGHNEDGNIFYKNKAKLFNITVPNENNEMVNFTSLIYPGMLAGYAFSFNQFGICESGYTAKANDTQIGIGRNFISRAICEATSLEDAITKLTRPNRAAGFSYTIGSISEKKVIHLEVSANQHHRKDITGTFVHTNHYIEMPEAQLALSDNDTSEIRYKRSCQLIKNNKIKSIKDIEDLLLDQKNSSEFVFIEREDLTTLLSIIFDLNKKVLHIYEFDNLKNKIKSTIPLLF